MYRPLIRIIVIVLSCCFLIVYVNPLRWDTGVFRFLKEAKEQDVQIYIGVIEQIYEDDILILLESEKENIVVNKDQMPESYEEGTWVSIYMYSDGMMNIVIRDDLTRKYNHKINELMDQLLK